MLLDFLKIVLNNLSHRKLRSCLTIIGIFIGIAAVVSLISLTQSVNLAIKEQFEKMGVDKILIMPKSTEGGIFSGTLAAKPLTERDVEKIKKLRGVENVAGIIFKVARVTYKGKTKNMYVIGIPLDETKKMVETMKQFAIEKGRDLKKDKYECIIGHSVAYDIFDDVKTDDYIEIEGKKFKVVGILEKIGSRMDDYSIVISKKVAKRILNVENEVSFILAKAKRSEEVDKVAEEIEEKLRKFKNEKEGEESFEVQTSRQLMLRVQKILGIFQILLIGIASISLLVGGIGIMNTQYTSVLERTREIGIMKAIGASNRDIFVLFLIESGIIGLIGGIIGCGIGFALAKLIEMYAIKKGFGMLKAYFDPLLFLGSLAFSFIIGSFAGFAPARRAAKLQPAEALRYE